MTLAIVAAFASAAFFAAGTSLQHHAAGPSTKVSSLQMVTALARRPGWLAGMGLSGIAFALHATALKYGELSVVQPIVVSGIVFAVILRDAADRHLPSAEELRWAGLTWAGLALFISMAHSSPPQPPNIERAIWFASVSVVVVGVVVLVTRRQPSLRNRGLLLGSSCGILFALVAGLIKLTLVEAGPGIKGLLLQWPPWVMLAVGAWALFLNQRAYQGTRLSGSMPVLNIVDVLVATGFGFVVFGERLSSSPGTLLGELVGLVAMGWGVARLAGLPDSYQGAPEDKTVTERTAP